MRKALLTGAAAGALLAAAAAVPAGAADLPRRAVPAPAPAYTPAPVFTWSGFYIGANAGAAWNDDDDHRDGLWFNDPRLVLPGGVGVFGHDEGGDARFTGGLTVGANAQFGQFVLGVEGDINYLDRARDVFGWGGTTFTFAGNSFTVLGAGDEEDDNWFATLRARGGVAFDRFLVYATGGLAFGGNGDGNGFVAVRNNTTGVVTTFAGGNDDSAIGWTVGGGVEAAVTDNISVKLEYLYVRFEESHGIDPIGSIVLGTPVTWDRDNDAHVVRAGINFRFNLFAPPPAPAPVYTRG